MSDSSNGTTIVFPTWFERDHGYTERQLGSLVRVVGKWARHEPRISVKVYTFCYEKDCCITRRHTCDETGYEWHEGAHHNSVQLSTFKVTDEGITLSLLKDDSSVATVFITNISEVNEWKSRTALRVEQLTGWVDIHYS